MVIAGANGFLGRCLARHWAEAGHEVVGLVRGEGVELGAGCRVVRWDGRTLGEWAGELEGAEALVNLAGRSVNCRYHARNRAEILQSRVASTTVLGEAISRCKRPPAVWVNSSTATIYRHAEDRPQDEQDGEIGEGFSVEVAQAWERAFFGARVPGAVRKVAIRTAIVLGREPGTVLSYLVRLARLGLGGPMGSGRQRVSWIHSDDFCRAVSWLIAHRECDGIVNLSSPEPVLNRELMREVRRAVGAPVGLPAAAWMLRLGAMALRTETELILKSRWVVPARLSAAGFRFRWTDLDAALDDLVGDHHRGKRGEKSRCHQMKSLSS